MASRHAHHVAERCEDHTRSLGDRDRVVDATHRDHADRATWTVHEFDRLWQDMLDAVPINGVRVATAHLHELEVVVARQIGDTRY